MIIEKLSLLNLVEFKVKSSKSPWKKPKNKEKHFINHQEEPPDVTRMFSKASKTITKRNNKQNCEKVNLKHMKNNF